MLEEKYLSSATVSRLHTQAVFQAKTPTGCTKGGHLAWKSKMLVFNYHSQGFLARVWWVKWE